MSSNCYFSCTIVYKTVFMCSKLRNIYIFFTFVCFNISVVFT